MLFTSSFAALAAFATAASALTIPVHRHQANHTLAARQDPGPKKVFAHFMVGVVAAYSQADWEADIKQAMGVGIDGFALNVGTDDYTPTQLANAYAAASSVGGGNFKMFISFDFTRFDVNNVGPVADLIKQFGVHESQLKIGDKAFVSSFYGDNFKFRDAEAQSGVSLFSCPAWGPEPLAGPDADCGFQWNSWPSKDNKPVDEPMTVDGDNWWIKNLNGKPYMAGASPWFFTHYPADTFDGKNWLFKSDTLWTDRWQQLLELQPAFIEIITWNDFGESHYIGPLKDDNQEVYAGGENGARRWVAGHDHSAWATVAAPYIAAFKAGSTTPTVDTDHLVYQYRQQSKNAQCSDFVAPPDGAAIVEDAIFVTAMLTSPGTVVITSGGNAPVSIEVDAGVHTVKAPMGVGKQSFALVRGGNTVISGDGYRDVRDTCDVNDFNAFVGEVTGAAAPNTAPPPPPSDSTPPVDPAPAPPADPAPAPPAEPAPAPPTEPAPAPPAEPAPAPPVDPAPAPPVDPAPVPPVEPAPPSCGLKMRRQ